MILQVGVKVALRNEYGKILILRRSADKYHKAVGQWDLPGGRIDAGSPLRENLDREVREETELALTSEPRLIAAQDILLFEDRHIVRLTYVAETKGEPVLDGEEHDAYRWATLEELKDEKDLDTYVQSLLSSSQLSIDSWKD